MRIFQTYVGAVTAQENLGSEVVMQWISELLRSTP